MNKLYVEWVQNSKKAFSMNVGKKAKWFYFWQGQKQYFYSSKTIGKKSLKMGFWNCHVIPQLNTDWTCKLSLVWGGGNYLLYSYKSLNQVICLEEKEWKLLTEKHYPDI